MIYDLPYKRKQHETTQKKKNFTLELGEATL